MSHDITELSQDSWNPVVRCQLDNFSSLVPRPSLLTENGKKSYYCVLQSVSHSLFRCGKCVLQSVSHSLFRCGKCVLQSVSHSLFRCGKCMLQSVSHSLFRCGKLHWEYVQFEHQVSCFQFLHTQVDTRESKAEGSSEQRLAQYILPFETTTQQPLHLRPSKLDSMLRPQVQHV